MKWLVILVAWRWNEIHYYVHEIGKDELVWIQHGK